jgi:hypothetical protein
MKISRNAQVMLPDLQIPFVVKAFRAYVKPMNDDVFYRVERSLVPKKPAKKSLETIRKEVKLDNASLIECLVTF